MANCTAIGTDGTINKDISSGVPDGYVLSPNPLPVNPIWDNGLQNIREKTIDELLADSIKAKHIALKAEGLRRMQLVNSSVYSFDMYKLLEAQFNSARNSVKLTARDAVTLDPILQRLKNLYDVGVSAASVINGMTIDELNSYDVTTSPGWPE